MRFIQAHEFSLYTGGKKKKVYGLLASSALTFGCCFPLGHCYHSDPSSLIDWQLIAANTVGNNANGGIALRHASLAVELAR